MTVASVPEPTFAIFDNPHRIPSVAANLEKSTKEEGDGGSGASVPGAMLQQANLPDLSAVLHGSYTAIVQYLESSASASRSAPVSAETHRDLDPDLAGDILRARIAGVLDLALKDEPFLQKSTLDPLDGMDLSTVSSLKSVSTSTFLPTCKSPMLQVCDGISALVQNDDSKHVFPGESHVADASRVVRIQLEPESLGCVDINLTFVSGEIKVHMRSETPEAAAVLHRDRDELLNSLQALGHNVSRIDFDSVPLLRDAPTDFVASGGNGAPQPGPDTLRRSRELRDRLSLEGKHEVVDEIGVPSIYGAPSHGRRTLLA